MKHAVRPKRPTSRSKVNVGIYQRRAVASSVFVSKKPSDLRLVARAILEHSTAQLLLLRGPLGSGKTTLTRELLRCLGYTGRVTSPTFVLRHDFTVSGKPWKRVVHIDAYRIASSAQEVALDISSALGTPGCLVIIEWPERLESLPSVPTTSVQFRHVSVGRNIRITY